MVDLVPAAPVEIIVPYTTRDQLTAEVHYDGPIEAPVEKGAPIGKLVISVPGISDVSLPLVAGATVEKGGFVGRFLAAAQILSQRVLDAATSTAQ